MIPFKTRISTIAFVLGVFVVWPGGPTAASMAARLAQATNPVANFSWVDVGTLGWTEGMGGNWPGGFHPSEATAINDYGQVIGTARLANSTVHEDGVTHVYLWTPGGTDGFVGNPQMLDTRIAGKANDLNNSAQIVGQYNVGPETYAFLWTRGATGGVPWNPAMRDLGTLGGNTGPHNRSFITAANAINEAGRVVGYSQTGPTYVGIHAFLWTSGGTAGVASNPQMEDLGTLGHEGNGGGAYWGSIATDINNHEEVVGYSLVAEVQQHAFLWSRGATDGVVSNPRMLDLGTLGGERSAATAISDDGVVYGWSELGNGLSHAFRWKRGATDGAPSNPQMKDLGSLGAGSFALAVNGETVVGYSEVLVGFQENEDGYLEPIYRLRPFRYTPSTGMVEVLGDDGVLGTQNRLATGVNAQGQITVSTSYHGFLATPVPYNICVLFDQAKAHKAGSTIPIQLQLCDAAGSNVSSTTVPLVATGVYQVSTNAPGPLEDSGNANPDFQFRFAGGKYIFNLSLKGFTQGTYALAFTAGGDPTPHSVTFQVR